MSTNHWNNCLYFFAPILFTYFIHKNKTKLFKLLTEIICHHGPPPVVGPQNTCVTADHRMENTDLHTKWFILHVLFLVFVLFFLKTKYVLFIYFIRAYLIKQIQAYNSVIRRILNENLIIFLKTSKCISIRIDQ